MLYVDIDKKTIGGVAKAKDIKQKGLIKASQESDNEMEAQ